MQRPSSVLLRSPFRFPIPSYFHISVVFVCLVGASLASADDWPQFRGPNASGVSTETNPLPTEFSTEDGTNIAWSVKLGDGIACPIVVGDRCITTAMSGDETFTMLAYDTASGRELWKTDLATGKLPRITPPNAHASSTPCSDGKRVYAHFSTLGLIALDIETGKLEWKFLLPKPAYLMDWGAAMSPIVYENTVYFCQDDDLAPTLFAVDAATGTLRWQVARPDMLAGYAVPVLCTAGGRTDLVLAGSGKLKGYDPATGKELWTCNTMPRTVMTSPVVIGDIIYVSVQSYGDETRTLKFALLEWLDTNQNGELTVAEVPKEFATRFKQSDKDGDGVLRAEELDTAFQSPDNMVGGGTTIQAVRGGGSGDVTKTHVLWNVKNKSPSNLSSPVVAGEQLFVVKKGGISSSFDTKAGATQWELKRIRNAGDYYASPVAADGKIFVTGENGFITVLKAGPELEVLARNDLGDSIIATPAISAGRLFVRTKNSLVCVQEK